MQNVTLFIFACFELLCFFVVFIILHLKKLQCSLQSLSSITSNDRDSASNLLRLPLWDQASADFCFAKSRELLTRPLNITSYSDLSEISTIGCDLSSLHSTLKSTKTEGIHNEHDYFPEENFDVLEEFENQKDINDDTLTRKSSKKHNEKSIDKSLYKNYPSNDESSENEIVRAISEKMIDKNFFEKNAETFKSSPYDLLETIDRSLTKVGLLNTNRNKSAGDPDSPQYNTKNASLTPKSVKSPNANYFLFPDPKDDAINSSDINQEVYNPHTRNIDVYTPVPRPSCIPSKHIPKSDSFSRKKYDRNFGDDSDTLSLNMDSKYYVQKIKPKQKTICMQEVNGRNYLFYKESLDYDPFVHNSSSSIHSALQVPTVNSQNIIKNDNFYHRPRAMSFSERGAQAQQLPVQKIQLPKIFSSKSIHARNLRRQSYNPDVYGIESSSSDSDDVDYSISYSECDIRFATKSSKTRHTRNLSCRKSYGHKNKMHANKNGIISKFSNSNSSIKSVPQNFIVDEKPKYDDKYIRAWEEEQKVLNNQAQNNYDAFPSPFVYNQNHNAVNSRTQNAFYYPEDNAGFENSIDNPKKCKKPSNNFLHPNYGYENTNFDVSKLTGKSPPPSQNFLNGIPIIPNVKPVNKNRGNINQQPVFDWPEAISASAVMKNGQFIVHDIRNEPTPASKENVWNSRHMYSRKDELSSSDSSDDSLVEFTDFGNGFPPSPAP